MIHPHTFFENAARNLRARYYRRFGGRVHWSKVDETSIKQRWYDRMSCLVVRERLGKR